MQKMILPLLTIGIILILFFTYFVPKDDLGSFSSYSTNSNASQDIIVKLVHDKGFRADKNLGTIFYVTDKAGKEMKVHGPLDMPPGLDMTSRVTLRGHLHDDYFHAAEVTLRN